LLLVGEAIVQAHTPLALVVVAVVV